jgi:hypothetical protein
MSFHGASVVGVLGCVKSFSDLMRLFREFSFAALWRMVSLVEHCHRGVNWITYPRLGFKSLAVTHDRLVGIELMHMIKKRQLVLEEGDESLTAAEQCYSLTRNLHPDRGYCPLMTSRAKSAAQPLSAPGTGFQLSSYQGGGRWVAEEPATRREVFEHVRRCATEKPRGDHPLTLRVSSVASIATGAVQAMDKRHKSDCYGFRDPRIDP